MYKCVLVLLPSKSVDMPNEMNADFNEIPRLVEFEGMIVNDLWRWLRSSPEEFGEIIHPK
jgi:hypothetical protein